jgi:hypothetical protein
VEERLRATDLVERRAVFRGFDDLDRRTIAMFELDHCNIFFQKSCMNVIQSNLFSMQKQ